MFSPAYVGRTKGVLKIFIFDHIECKLRKVSPIKDTLRFPFYE